MTGVLGRNPGRMSKLTMKLSIILMEVVDEGEGGRKIHRHFQKAQCM